MAATDLHSRRVEKVGGRRVARHLLVETAVLVAVSVPERCN
jgi:hypothetical protein